MKSRIIFIIILLIGALLRILYSLDLPLDGEEAGVATLQATGQAQHYSQKLPDVITPIDSIRNFIRYSPDHSARDVFRSLRYAGMHPPFYYLLLHYIIKFFGNSAIILRAISFFASLLSICYLYRLGKDLFNEKIGLYAAAFLAFSGYGIWLGTYVRPYSLIMLLSLVSTYQAYHLSISKAASFRNINLYLYILTVTLGLYTIYHFIFVFIFQIALILLTNFRNKNTIITTLFIITLVFLCFSAWIPSLRTQMNVVSKGHFYFHEKVDIFHFIGDAASINSVRYFQLNSFLLKSIIALIYASITTVVVVYGLYFSLKIGRIRIFALAIIIHLLAYLLLEFTMNLNTLHKIKMLFFIIPVLYFFLAAGFSHLPKGFHLRNIALTLFVAVLLANSVAACCIKPKLGSHGRYLEVFPRYISEYTELNDKSILILSSRKRRLLFPIIHATKINIDVKIFPSPSALSQLPKMQDLENYDVVFIADIRETKAESASFTKKTVKLSEYLNKYHFTLLEHIESGNQSSPCSLYIYKKTPIPYNLKTSIAPTSCRQSHLLAL